MSEVDQRPLFSCCNCFEVHSWHADNLRVYDNNLFCQCCFDDSDMAFGDNPIDWNDLPEFVPEYKKGIVELEQIIKDQGEAIDQLLAEKGAGSE